MWAVYPIRWSALIVLALVAALLALACGGRSAKRPDSATSEDSGSAARSLKS
jgi:hypothetical protein